HLRRSHRPRPRRSPGQPRRIERATSGDDASSSLPFSFLFLPVPIHLPAGCAERDGANEVPHAVEPASGLARSTQRPDPREGMPVLKRLASVCSVVALTASMASMSAVHADAMGANAYHVTRLVSDQPGNAMHTDPNLVNAWGLAAGPATPWWVADNEKDVSTLYDGT